jgi:hypothetical protein
VEGAPVVLRAARPGGDVPAEVGAERRVAQHGGHAAELVPVGVDLRHHHLHHAEDRRRHLVGVAGGVGVAIKAGARSALATLWTVNDPASALVVSDFYRSLRDPAISKAKALQRAQLAALKDPRYRHPNYWSAFLLIGNWL